MLPVEVTSQPLIYQKKLVGDVLPSDPAFESNILADGNRTCTKCVPLSSKSQIRASSYRRKNQRAGLINEHVCTASCTAVGTCKQNKQSKSIGQQLASERSSERFLNLPTSSYQLSYPSRCQLEGDIPYRCFYAAFESSLVFRSSLLYVLSHSDTFSLTLSIAVSSFGSSPDISAE